MQRSSVEKAEAARDLWVHKPITRGMTPYAWIPSFVSGEWLAYLSTESGKSEVYVRPVPDVESAKWQVSLSGGRTPMWAHSSKGLLPG
jgi:hypothetical protein